MTHLHQSLRVPHGIATPSTAAVARPRRRFLLAVLALLLALSCVATAQASDMAPGAEAERVAARAVEAMGGVDAWQGTRYLSFDFFGRRTHHWDRHQGRYRVEGKKDDQSFVVLMDLGTKDGKAWVDGTLAEGEAVQQWLDAAWGMWVNDTYWLLMPLKLRDPGVHLSSEGREEIDGKAYDKVKLTFEGVGLTPGDTYWAWFDTETGLMHRWAFHLQGWPADREPSAWDWVDWQTYGKVKLSSIRRGVADGSERVMSDIAVYDSLPDSIFQSPAPVVSP